MDTTLINAWLAGLLEGEGYFGKGYPSQPKQASIALEMTDKDIISRVSKLWGVKYCAPRVRDSNWSQTYKLQIRGARAIKWMKEIYPYMGLRRQARIDEVLKHCQ